MRLLLIAQPDSYRIYPYLVAARKMGYNVLIASEGEYSLTTEVHEGLHVNLNTPEESLQLILDESKRSSFAGIIGCDDSTVYLAALVAKKLNLPHNPPLAARLSYRKDLARKHLKEKSCNVPEHTIVNLEHLNLDQITDKDLFGIDFPCVIKPVNMSASRGVIRVNNRQESIKSLQRLKNIISDSEDEYEKTHVLIEKYIEGTEVAYEGYVENGKLTTITIFDKPEPLQGPYFQETIYVTPTVLDEKTQDIIKDCVLQATSAYGLTTGTIHAELRIDNNNKAWILEVASRTIGGNCARIFDTHEEYFLESLTIKLATQQDIKITPHTVTRGVMMIPVLQKGLLRRVEGQSDARKVNFINKLEIVVPENHELIPLPEGNQYLGYIFASGKTSEIVTKSLQEAYSKLNVVTAPVLDVAVES